MRVLVIEQDGQLGRCLVDLLKKENIDFIGTSKDEVDVCKYHQVDSILNDQKPNIVINASAYTDVKKAEKDNLKAYAINQNGIKNIAIACEKYNINIIHVSTDYVFDGLSNVPYSEKCITNPQNIYGKSKLAGEDELFRYSSKSIIVRTSWVFSEYGHNFVKTMLSILNTKNDISVVSDQHGCPTYAGDVAKVILDLCSKFDGKNLQEIYHFSGSPSCSWYDFANFIFNKAFNLGLIEQVPNLIPVSSNEYNSYLKRPPYSVMDSSKYYKEFKKDKFMWQNSIEKVIFKK